MDIIFGVEMVRLTAYIFVLVMTCISSFAQHNQVYTFQNPFYEDCRLVDFPTYQYIKSEGIRYLKKTEKTGQNNHRIIEHFYNERAVLDSVKLFENGVLHRISKYSYDDSSRLILKIDSFASSNKPDSVRTSNWAYLKNGHVSYVNRHVVYYDQPGFKRFTLFATIAYDTTIGDMMRYKSVYLVGLNGKPLYKENNPIHYWIQDGNLVWYGTEEKYHTMTIDKRDLEIEVKYHVYRGDSASLMRISRYDQRWQIKASKVLYNGLWELLEDHRYDVNGYELMNTKYDPVTKMKSTTTFIRDPSTGKIEKTLSPTTEFDGKKDHPTVSVTEVIYTYSTDF